MARNKDELFGDYSDLPELTEIQMGFVEAILSGKTAAEAIRASRDTSSWSDNAVWVEGTRQKNHPKISLWLEVAKHEGLMRVSSTFEAHLAQLERLREIALRTGNLGAAVQAQVAKGKAEGHHVERHEDMTPKDPTLLLERIARKHPEYAKELARKNNLAWEPKPSVH